MLICNFAKSEKPVLNIIDVKTLFHEFGHVMHNICCGARFSSHSADNVERDFLEIPSQVLEQWLRDGEILRRLSKHVESGEQLS